MEEEIAAETAPAPPIVSLEYETKAELGEGAFWNHETQRFYWVDILGKQLHIFDPATKINKSFPTPSMIGTVVPQTDSTAVVALLDGIYMMNTNNGELEVLSNIEKDVTMNRFNDGKCDPLGNLWVGSLNMPQDQATGKLYKVAPDGTATEMLDNITISNGIVWTQDAKTMYYIDTPTAKIRAFDFDPATATISNERTAVEVPESLGFPDGMAIDAEDKLWVGMWNGNAVVRFDPETGEMMSKIPIPAHNVTACAFGGRDLDILYITTASVDMTHDEQQGYPQAGSLFSVRPGVKGVPSTLFAKQ